MVESLDQPIPIAQPPRQTCGVAAVDRQTPAIGRTVQSEGSDYGITAQAQGTIHDPKVRVPIGRVGQEVEGGPIMPDVEASKGLPVQQVAHHPFDRRVLRKSRRAFARAVSERSSTVIRRKPRFSRQSTSREEPPPTSTMAASVLALVSAMSSSDSCCRASCQLVSPLPCTDRRLPTGSALRTSSVSHSSIRRSRRALLITDTDDRLIAAAAIIGESNIPVNG